jgi:uncharacterized membrane protein
MLQRIQSIFLLAGLLIHAILFKVSFYSGSINTLSEIRYTAWQHENLTSHEIHLNLFHIILQFILIGLSIYTIFKYKNRKAQMKLCWYLVLGTLISFAFSIYSLFTANYTAYEFGFGTYLITIAAILYICAYFFIKKDEELVRSADRLR